jgi:hypothetical protein
MESHADLSKAIHDRLGKILANGEKHQDYKKIDADIRRLRQWIHSDRSVLEHRCYHAFVTYLWQSYGTDYPSRDLFHTELKCRIGHCHIDRRIIEVQGEKVKVIHTMPKSVSFGKCPQKLFHKVFERIQGYALEKWGVKFEEWKREHDFGDV